jgi:hypothetical protein
MGWREVKFPETVFAPLRSTGDSFQTSSSVDILELQATNPSLSL